MEILRLSHTQVKICQISYVNFETTCQFLSKFCIPFQFHERLFLCTFLTQRIYNLHKRSPLKSKFLRLSSARVKFVKFLMPILKRVNSSRNFVSLFRLIKDYSSVPF